MSELSEKQQKKYSEFISRHNIPLEIALDLTGFGKFNYLMLVICCLSLLAMVMEIFGISFVMTAATCDLNLSIMQKGILSAMPMIGIIFMSYPWGYITDTKGRRLTLMISMSFGFLFSFLSSFSPNMAVLATFKLFSVTFMSAANSSVYALMGEFQPKRYRDKMLLFATTGMMFISGINGLLALPVLTMLDLRIPIAFLNIVYRPWRLLIVVLGLPSAISAILLLWISESPKFLLSQGRSKEALTVLRRVYAMNTGDIEYNYPVDSILFEEKCKDATGTTFLQTLWKQCSPIFQKPLLQKTLILYYLQFSIYFVSNAFALWMPFIANKFLTGLEENSERSISFCSVIDSSKENEIVADIFKNDIKCDDSIKQGTFWIIIALSAINCLLHFVSIYLVNCFGKKGFTIGLMVFTGICGLLTNLVKHPIAGIVLFISFNYVTLLTGVVVAMAVEIYPTCIRGMSLCLLVMVSRCGAIIGTNLVGLLLESHCDSSFYFYSLMILSCGAIAVLLPKDEKNNNRAYIPEVTRL